MINNNISEELTTDLSQLLESEGDLVQELSKVATKAAGFHARLEAIEKAIKTDPSSYCSKEAGNLVSKAEEKYSDEIEGSMKEHATNILK